MYLPAIEGYVPSYVLRTFRAFLEFCYIARHDIINEDTLTELKDALTRFHHYRTIFEDIGIRPEGFALPRQHSLDHYAALIRLFGAPNGLCSSITESKHIVAIKKPWRRSNRYKALGQMLLTNQRLDKLAASHVDFENRGMLDGTCLSDALKLIGKFFTFVLLFQVIIVLKRNYVTMRDSESLTLMMMCWMTKPTKTWITMLSTARLCFPMWSLLGRFVSISLQLLLGFDLKNFFLQIANFPLLILPQKLTNLTLLNMFDDSSMISFILTATSLRLTYLWMHVPPFQGRRPSSCLLLPHIMPQVIQVESGACITNIFELLPPGGGVLHVMIVFL